MTRVVYAYDLRATPDSPRPPADVPVAITMPVGAKVLAVAPRSDQYAEDYRVHALVDPDRQETVQRRFVVLGTGVPLDLADDEWLDHWGTQRFYSGTLVLHVFEVRKGTAA